MTRLGRTSAWPAAMVAALVALSACTSNRSAPTSDHSGSRVNSKLAAAVTLADQGNASALTLIRRTTKPSGGCPRPRYYATVDSRITGRKLAADELAFFTAHTSLDQGRCSALLFVFHSGQSTTGNGGYTAGAVLDDGELLEVHVNALGSAPFASYHYG